MPDLHITAHAIIRAIERIPGVESEAEARAALTSSAILTAASFGAPFVKLGTGQHVVIVAGRVVTVLPAKTCVGVFDRRRVR